jgi:site-specific DNA-methyltransferase (adenine-specific)
MNLVTLGDALDLAAKVPLASAELAYLDPPFAVGTVFGARMQPNEERARSSSRSGPAAYDDRWPSLDAYLRWLGARLEALRPLLSPRGTLWLHLDHRAVHEAKVLGDSLFERFLGEIIWVPGNGSKARRGPGMTHQTLLLYAMSDDFIWNNGDPALRETFAKTSLAMHFTKVTADGRAYRERTVSGKTYRYYADQGRTLGSVWTDCPSMVANTPLCSETTGYPTQKPLALLERIVRASSCPGGLVVDPFCGSGTTLVAATRLGRRYVGCDTSPLAIEVTRTRLEREVLGSLALDPLR